jgi:TnpA family transposase
MPRRTILNPNERALLLAFPEEGDEFIRHYTLHEPDFAVIRQRRGDHNRLGFAIQLCYLRYPGFALPPEATPPERMLIFASRQLDIQPDLWPEYAQRAETRREHLLELQAWLGLTPFGIKHYRAAISTLLDLVKQTDKGIVLASALIEHLRQNKIIIPTVDVIERVCAHALTRGTRQVYNTLTSSLTEQQLIGLDGLLDLEDGCKTSPLAWLQQSPGAPNARNILTHIDRLKKIQVLGLPEGMEHLVHQNRLLKFAREGAQMTAQHLRDLETKRRHATVTAVVISAKATLIDEVIDMHDRILGTLFNRAKKKHSDRFQEKGKAINDKVRLYSRIGRALLEAKSAGTDPFAAIEAIVPWDFFTNSIAEAETLAQPEEFDYLPLISDGFAQIRRYVPALLNILQMEAVPAVKELLEAINVIKQMNEQLLRKIPDNAPTGFIRKRWQNLVHTAEGVDRRFYELCVYSEVKNALRSGDIWVHGSRQYKDFQEYLLPTDQFLSKREQLTLGLTVETDHNRYMASRIGLLEQELKNTENLAARNEIPDAIFTNGNLKISPLDKVVPDEADDLIRKSYALMPHVKITDILLEVDKWTNFSRHFTHLKSNEPAADKNLLLTVLLADGVNLGLAKMAESCPGSTFAKLAWLQAWHVRDETYSAALAEIINAQFRHPFAAMWGDGTTSSSDGQRFRAGGQGEGAGYINAKYGSDPIVQFYTHISDQYAPFHTKVINSPIRDATHVLDGLLNHESDLRIEEHYTDTAGYTDHVFALMHLLGFRFAPRIRDLKDSRIYIPGSAKDYPTLSVMIGGSLDRKRIEQEWNEIIRLGASIKQGTVTSSLMLRKLSSYPRQNGLATALRELGRIERSLFILDWLQHPELRRRVQIGLNKGEAKNALARAVFFNRLGELRDRSFENQRYRASGLNLIVSAIVLWNTVYLERAIDALQRNGESINKDLLQHLSPLGWDHINLTGDYFWRQSKQVEQGKFRPLRPQAGK